MHNAKTYSDRLTAAEMFGGEDGDASPPRPPRRYATLAAAGSPMKASRSSTIRRAAAPTMVWFSPG
jgi:hypothetical protein